MGQEVTTKRSSVLNILHIISGVERKYRAKIMYEVCCYDTPLYQHKFSLFSSCWNIRKSCPTRKCKAMKAYRSGSKSPGFLDVSSDKDDQLHGPAALTSHKETLTRSGEDAGWAPDQAWM
jgi:hypothetical protein